MSERLVARRSKESTLRDMHDGGVVAVVRADAARGIVETVDALIAGGLTAIEITFTTPGAVDIIRELAARHDPGAILLGAGTVMTAAETEQAVAAGAEYIVSPSIEVDVIQASNAMDVVSIPGAFTPTEIRTAVKAGADIVKVFPASIGGPAYIKDLSGPLPGVRLLPSGSVSFETVGPFFAAGAFAVAVGSLLVDKQLIRDRQFEAITERTRQFMDLVKSSRSSR